MSNVSAAVDTNGTNETTNESKRALHAMTSAQYGLASGVAALAVDLTLLASAVENGGGALTLADIGHSTERIAERARYLAELAGDLQIEKEEIEVRLRKIIENDDRIAALEKEHEALTRKAAKKAARKAGRR